MLVFVMESQPVSDLLHGFMTADPFICRGGPTEPEIGLGKPTEGDRCALVPSGRKRQPSKMVCSSSWKERYRRM